MIKYLASPAPVLLEVSFCEIFSKQSAFERKYISNAVNFSCLTLVAILKTQNKINLYKNPFHYAQRYIHTPHTLVG